MRILILLLAVVAGRTWGESLPPPDSAAENLPRLSHREISGRPYLEYQEFRRHEGPAQLEATGTLVAHALPLSGPYDLFVQTLSYERVFRRLTIDEQGRLLDRQGHDPLILHFQTLSWGEPVYLSLRATHGDLSANLIVIPFPIERMDEQGHRLLLTRNDRYGSSFRLRGTGYVPGEPVTLIMGEEQPLRFRANFEGGFETILNLALRDCEGGTAHVTLNGQNSSLTLAYHYGAHVLMHD